MTERSIVDAAARLRRHGEAYLVATVVGVGGASYRGPGARLLLTRFRWIAGGLSGGCLEGDLSSTGWLETRGGQPVLRTYDAMATECGAIDEDIRAAFGLGCDGSVEVLVERAGIVGRIDPLAFAERCLHGQRRGAIATVFRSRAAAVQPGARLALLAGGNLEGEDSQPIEGILRAAIAADLEIALASGESASRSYETPDGLVEVFVEAVMPPPRLFIFGSGHDAVPVANLAHALGWDVVVCCSEQRHATRDRFPMASALVTAGDPMVGDLIAASDRAVAVVMHHEPGRDRDSLATLVASDVRFIGVLGPRSRADRLLGELAGVDVADPRVHEIGRRLGGESVQETALSIIAELQAALAGPVRTARTRSTDRPLAVERASWSGAGSAAMAAAGPAL